MPCRAAPRRTAPHRIASYISHHIISYHIISYHIISYHIISYHIISYIISYHIIYHITSHHITSTSHYITPHHIISYHIISGFNHGLSWCVKYMARGPAVTTKPDGEAAGFCGDRRPEGNAASPNHLWFQCFRMVQVFKSMLMVINWYKTEIAQYFSKWCFFFYIYYQLENMNRKGLVWVKASEGRAMPFHTAPPTRHGQNHHQSAINHIISYHITSHHITSHHIISNHTIWYHIYHIISFHAMSCHVMSCHGMSCYRTSRHGTSWLGTSCHHNIT